MIELGLQIDKISFTVNGAEAISKAKSILEKAIDQIKGNQKKNVLQPITIMLLDFQMPKKNGIQVL